MEKRICLALFSFYFRIKAFLLGLDIGRNSLVDGILIIRVYDAKAVSIGDNFRFEVRKRSNLAGISNTSALVALPGGNIIIGSNCGFSACVISSREKIVIGNHVKLGVNVKVYDHNFHSLDYIKRRKASTDSLDVASEPVIIEDDVFIGADCLILKGVKIGARSIVAAGSVVTLKNVPADSLIGGNPARIIKSLR